MRWLFIQAMRPATSVSPFITARVGLPPQKENATLPSFSRTCTDGKRAFSLRKYSSRDAGTRRAWASMIILFLGAVDVLEVAGVARRKLSPGRTDVKPGFDRSRGPHGLAVQRH